MKKSKIQIPSEKDFNLKYGFGNDLLEIPEDPQSVHNYCQSCMAWLEEELGQPEKQWDVKSIVQVLGKTAAYMKMIRELDEALKLIETSLSLIEQHDLGPKSFVAQSLRWADILRYRGEFGEAEQILDDILDMCEKLDGVSFYKDFALQHLGKLNFDLGEYDIAFAYFEKALILRKIKGDQELIESTNFAISVTASKLGSNKF
jgi:tetratricopeptide (TPR) repeat protein